MTGRRLLGLLGRILLAGALVLPVWELGLRWICFAPTASDPDFGAIMAPGIPIRWGLEGWGTSLWTVHGVRRDSPPDPRRPSILAIGDSFTQALMIDDDDVYPAVLEAGLRQRGYDLPVLNVGNSGLSVPDYIERAPRYRDAFDLRWTVVQLRDDDFGSDAWAAGKTHFARDGNGALAVVAPPRRAIPLEGFVRALLQRSALLYAGQLRAMEFLNAARHEPPLFGAASVRPDPAPPRDVPVEEELRLLESAWGERMTILYLARFDVDRPREPSETERRVFRACAAHGWSCVNLRQVFPQLAARWRAPYGFANSGWNTGHLNARGHRAAGELLARELERVLSR